jgi:ribonuclease HII
LGLPCGVDEAGRGPLAGPVVAAAVILDPAQPIKGLADSKKLSAAKREKLAVEIRAKALAWCVAEASVEEIDTLNILQATLLAMQRAVAGLATLPQGSPRVADAPPWGAVSSFCERGGALLLPSEALIDGNRCPKLAVPVRAIVGGDATVAEISAASILAKTTRDAGLLELHAAYPQYGFDRHKGYGTAAHLAALREYGPTPQHRKSFAPVREQLELFA